MPGRNFARFNLMMYILFCLVIRTAYQGVQFDLMLKEVMRKDFQTIDELLEKNITIYGIDHSMVLTQQMSFNKR